jgi:HTH-type transcriptional repressor of NAD biosynthesis genes
MKRFKRGMVLGKFMPLHKGHMYLIDTAIEQSEHVDIFVCSLLSDPIPGNRRNYWMEMEYGGRDDVDIHWVTDENPQTPEEYGDYDGFYRIWCDTVYSRTSNLDVIFTSEDYGDEFAHELKIEHVLVDIDRNKYPISGTKVRNNAFEHWDLIPSVVQKYYKKLIIVLGPESTGKSTLISRLAYHFDGDIVEEYGRTYTDIKSGTELDLIDFESISSGHKDNIGDVHTNGEKKLIFIDTEALTTYIFGLLYLGLGFNSEELVNTLQTQKFDLALLCNTDVPWVDDGTRDFPNKRLWHFDYLETSLKQLNINHKLISGSDYDSRFEQAKEEVIKIL